MKKVIALVAAVAFVLSMATMASAAHQGRADLGTSGFLQTSAGYADGTNFKEEGGSTFYAEQRLRQYWDYTASENLKATVGYEIDAEWGANDDNTNENFGAQVGADSTAGIAIKRANMQFTLPGTETSVKSGIQFISLPSVAMGFNPVLAGDMAGVTVSTPVTDVADLTFGWSRGYKNDGDNAAPGLDTFFATMPMGGDGMSFAPFAAYSSIGDSATLPVNNQGYRSGFNTPDGYIGSNGTGDRFQDLSAFWVGTNFEMTQMDPIGVKASFIYGALQADQDINERSGWYADLSVDYEMPNMTPEVFAMYSSGEDDDASDGSETMPAIWNDGLTSKGPSMMIGDMSSLGINTPGVGLLQASPMGLWTAGISLNHIQLTEGLTGSLVAAYYQGTNDDQITDDAGNAVDLSNMDNALTDEDSAWDITASSKYEIYENLSAIMEVGYAKLDLDSGDKDEPATRLAFGLNYSF